MIDRPGAVARTALALVTLVWGGSILGCATPGVGSIESNLDEIQLQLFRVEKENAELAETIAEIRDAATSGPTPARGEIDVVLRMRLESIERDLAAIRTRQDDSEQRMSALVQDLRTTRHAVEALLRSLPAPENETQAVVPGAAGGAVTATDGAATIEAPLTAAGRETDAASSLSGAAALEDLFRQGYSDYTKGNYALAVQQLSEFAERYPASALADDARYFIGEVYFRQEQYNKADDAFDRVIRDYPSGDKAGPAYLKKGLSLLELNLTADAVIQLQHVITTYPGTEEARIARDRLRGLGLTER